MGWMRTIFLGDIGNRLDIADTEQDLSVLRSRIGTGDRHDDDQDASIRRLESEIDELRLVIVKLTGILEREGVLRRSDLEALAALEGAGSDDTETT
ncbi:MAG: hypothetical protein ACR2GQ_06315 [Gemmatimonadota bacterium]